MATYKCDKCGKNNLDYRNSILIDGHFDTALNVYICHNCYIKQIKNEFNIQEINRLLSLKKHGWEVELFTTDKTSRREMISCYLDGYMFSICKSDLRSEKQIIQIDVEMERGKEDANANCKSAIARKLFFKRIIPQLRKGYVDCLLYLEFEHRWRRVRQSD